MLNGLLPNITKRISAWWNDTESNLSETTMPNREPRLYVIVREDLAYKYIQGQHVVAQYAIEHPASLLDWNNGYLINLSVFNGIAIEKLWDELNANDALEDVCKSAFIEPDLGDKMTSIAIFENGDGHVAEALNHLRLATR